MNLLVFTPIVLADSRNGSWIELLVPVLFILFSIIFGTLKKWAEEKEQEKRQQRIKELAQRAKERKQQQRTSQLMASGSQPGRSASTLPYVKAVEQKRETPEDVRLAQKKRELQMRRERQQHENQQELERRRQLQAQQGHRPAVRTADVSTPTPRTSQKRRSAKSHPRQEIPEAQVVPEHSVITPTSSRKRKVSKKKTSVGKYKHPVANLLSRQKNLKAAIILSEVIGPPVSMRD